MLTAGRTNYSRQRGFTLLELLMVLVIVSLLSMLVVPNMYASVQRSKQSACVNDAVTMLNLARAEAVTLQLPVALCGSSDQASCDTENWEDGGLLFVDDGTGAGGTAQDRDINGTEQRLRVIPASCSDSTMRAYNFADAGGITFTADGMTAERGTLVICNETGAEGASAVVLNISGQPRLATDNNADGTVEADDGSEVTCP